jgi:3-phosphoshikimate 1-carboxyvinyltransferase
MTDILQSIQIKKNPYPGSVCLTLPPSKSESNRALIIEALTGKSDTILNLSTARDTRILYKLLKSKDKTLDVLDAGTTMRFLTAYFAVTNQEKILTGTSRMCQRPIGILVEAIRALGGDIDYIGEPGYPPVHIKKFQYSGKNQLSIRGDVSSQFISALLMIAPLVEKGLVLILKGKIGSRPYIAMTLGLMNHFGVEAVWDRDKILIPNRKYVPAEFRVDPDWSGASYWYSVVALSENATIELADLKMKSLQGDREIVGIMNELGVKSTFNPSGVFLSKKSHVTAFQFDFSDHPDLFQTVAITCAAKGITGKFWGLESLKIKETDRIAALQKELSKIGALLEESKKGEWILTPSDIKKLPTQIEIETYEDHRMAMAFAPLATLMDLQIFNPSVVDKSYPSFWSDFKRSGFKVNPD